MEKISPILFAIYIGVLLLLYAPKHYLIPIIAYCIVTFLHVHFQRKAKKKESKKKESKKKESEDKKILE